MKKKIIEDIIDEHIQLASLLKEYIPTVKKIALLFISSLEKGGKIIFCGNGGSAADSQHLAAELVGRFTKEKRALPSLALSTNTSVVTALGNDYGFENIFSKQVEALGKKDDVLVGISTSGTSKNVVKAIIQAKKMGIKTVGLLGKDGGTIKNLVDIALVVKHPKTARIQEMHILIGHILCKIVEDEFVKKTKKKKRT